MIVPLSLFFGFLIGAVAVVAGEGLALCWILRRLVRKKRVEEALSTGVDAGLDTGVDQVPLTFPCEKQGFAWVLEQDKFLMNLQHDPQAKGSVDRKNKKEYIEVSPVKKKAEIKDGCLILKDLDGCQTVIIQLYHCKIETISGSNFSSRKWMKRYPIKVESKTKIIYNGSKICYLYLETSWDKESWCKALRLASCSNMEKINWYTHLCKEFDCYLSSLTSEHPLFLKTSTVPMETTDNVSKMERRYSSRVRHFFKKIARKASKIGSEYKFSTASSANKAERKVGEKNLQNVLYTNESTKFSSTEKSSLQDLMGTTSASSTLLKSQQIPAFDEVWDEKYGFDECIFCLNLLLSRLFFDVRNSTKIRNLIKERIQRTVSSIRTPTFVGSLHCIGLNLGSRPPYLHSVRALPMDMKEAWAVEVEIEYSGGILLEIETRLEVCEPEFQKGIVNTSMETSSAGEVTSILFDGFKTYNQELNTSNDSEDEMNGLNDEIKSDNGDTLRQSRNYGWTSSCMSRWKTIVNSVLDHVSQVPISLEASVASIRGTLRLQVKPPPSDQIWFSFTSMPEINFNFNSAIGDYKIASTHLALLIGNRFKAAIRETLVLPNYECIYIPWMLSEKDDWLPQNAAPFIWVRQESELTGKDSSRPQHVESRMKTDSYEKSKTNPSHTFEHTVGEKTNAVSTHVSLVEPVLDDTPPEAAPTPLLPSDLLTSDIDLEDFSASLVSYEDTHDSTNQCRADHSEPSRISTVPLNGKTSKPQEEDTKSRKIGRRGLIKDMGRKMSEKLDERLRHTSRHAENVPSDDTGSSIREFSGETTSNNAPEDGEDMMEKKMGKELLKELGKKMSERFEEKMRHAEEMGGHAVENVSTDAGTRISVSADETTTNSSLKDLNVPLLKNEICDQDKTTSPLVSRTSTLTLREQNPKSSEDTKKTDKFDKTKKIWRKGRMRDLGKKMTDKFDEKRRHIEEKGRYIVERMIENSRSSDGSGSATFIQKSTHKASAPFN